MKNNTKLVLVFLAFIFILPSVIQIGPVSNTANIELKKTFNESYDHHDQIWIQNNTQFQAQAIAESWDGDGSEETPYIITGYLFDCETQPLRIWHTSVHWIFIDNVIDGVGDNVQCGTWIQNVTNGAIVNNEVYNRHSALAIEDVKDFKVTGNYIHDCWGNGIEFFGPMNMTLIQGNTLNNIGGSGVYSFTSRNSVVNDNTISNCGDKGISLLGVSINTNVTSNTITHCENSGIMVSNQDSSIVTDNEISNTGGYGIYIHSPLSSICSYNTISEVDGSGLRVSSADDTEIFENSIEYCTDDGFYLYSGTETSVHHNTVSNVSRYAVNLGSSTDHFSVTNNTFLENGDGCQICDDGTSNTVSYNYYDDWASPDNDVDGYVDTPYAFDGLASNQDEFPIADEGLVPTTTTETDSVTATTSTTETTDNTSITSNTTDDNPMSMNLVLIGGAVGAIIIVASLFLVKRR